MAAPHKAVICTELSQQLIFEGAHTHKLHLMPAWSYAIGGALPWVKARGRQRTALVRHLSYLC